MKNTRDKALLHLSWFFLLALLSTPKLYAQQIDEQNGINQDNYNIKQAVEFGVRITKHLGRSADLRHDGELAARAAIVQLHNGNALARSPWHLFRPVLFQ